MNRNQIEIVKALMRFPKRSDRKIADIAGVSQPTVTRCRHRLVEQGVISFLLMLDLEKLGYEIVAMTTIVIRSDKDRTALNDDKKVVFAVEVVRQAGLQQETYMPTAFVVSVHKNYGSYVEFIGKYRKCSDYEPILLETSKLSKPIKPFSFKDIPLGVAAT